MRFAPSDMWFYAVPAWAVRASSQEGKKKDASMAAKRNRKKGGKITGRELIVLLLVIFPMTNAVSSIPPIDCMLYVNDTYQELEGFGASNVWSSWELVVLANSHPEIYDILFGDLGLDILRLRNTYEFDSGYINRCAEVISEARARTGRPLKVLISSWTPPARLKSNNNLSGGGDATLKKDVHGEYLYEDYADWWANSVQQYASVGIDADYISMQNEPDYDADWESCRFVPSESINIAGYDTAFEAVYSELYSRMGSAMPKMLAPETASIASAGNYIKAIDDRSHVYGYDHHLYGCADGIGETGCAATPDYYITRMTNFGARYGDKPIMQTEFSDDSHVTTYQAAMDLAFLIYYSLIHEGVSAYLYWQLTWDDAGLASITWSNWTINPIYYAMRHYSAFTDPGWIRINTSKYGHYSSMLRTIAFISPDKDEVTLIAINLDSRTLPIMMKPDWFSIYSSEVYQSTSTAYWQDLGSLDSSMTTDLAGHSITTIHMTGNYLSDCAEVLTEGFGMNSDLSGNCYVDYDDFEIIINHWLDSDCDWPNDYCEGADFEPRDSEVDLFDLSMFSSQWLLCNDPNDPNCPMMNPQ